MLHRAPEWARFAAESSSSRTGHDVDPIRSRRNRRSAVQTGTIKKLVSERGFGFIAADDGKEYFFHRSGTETSFDTLAGGEKVSFEIEPSPKGPRAGRVRVQ
jgi:CspA family cold shock protein